MTIKMSEVFELPVTGLMCDDFKEGITIDDGEMYTIAAINAYDDNQERIAELEQALKLNDDEIANSEAIKTSIAALTDSKIKEQHQQINKFLELNASLNSQAVRQVGLHNKVVVENNELKAIVEQLRGGLGFYADCGHYKISDGRDVMIMDWGEKAEGALKQTRTQCLVSIQQQAIKDAIFNSEKVEFEGSHYVGTYVSLEDLEVNIKQLGDKS